MLSEKLEQYRELAKQLNALEANIASEVRGLKKSQEIDGLKVSYRSGMKKVDYAAAAAALELDLSDYVVEKIDYTKAVKDAGASAAELEPFTTVGNATVSFKLV